MPLVPATWRLLDAQVYPSDEGPSVSVLMQNASGRQVNLFAVRADTEADENPSVATARGALAAYWESSGSAFVLTGEGSPAELLDGAVELSRMALM
jgi:anti-sigma factor RsiW